MAVAEMFDVKITLYFKVLDSKMYGGTGSIGYAAQSFDHVLAPEKADEAMAERCRADMAAVFEVPAEKLTFISYEEYEAATNEEEDD